MAVWSVHQSILSWIMQSPKINKHAWNHQLVHFVKNHWSWLIPFFLVASSSCKCNPRHIQSYDRARPLQSCHHQRQTPTRKPRQRILRNDEVLKLATLLGISWGPHRQESGAAGAAATVLFFFSGSWPSSQPSLGAVSWRLSILVMSHWLPHWCRPPRNEVRSKFQWNW